ncbi:type II toxin-antitoxin system VapC family toxin [Lonepinella sp. MS14435]|uniref:type II toxin-antitoxin system VapC family toxin n=1 Tax=unclassified Lonepinella TaxID=2642006 RepID=UPI0036D8CD2F
MNGIKYLLDSCFIIRWHEQRNEVFEIIQHLDLRYEQCAYSVISYAELFSWQHLTEIDEQGLRYLLTDVRKLPLNDEVIEVTIQIRKHHKIKLPDALILATAKTYGLQLITLDEKLQRIWTSEVH